MSSFLMYSIIQCQSKVSYFPIFSFVALGKVAGGIVGVDSEIRRKKLHDFLYPCIMRTLEYQSHLEQNFDTWCTVNKRYMCGGILPAV